MALTARPPPSPSPSPSSPGHESAADGATEAGNGGQAQGMEPPGPGLERGEKSTGAAAPEAEYEYITGIRLILVIVSVTLCVFLMLLDMSIIATALPRITSDFHSLADVGWYGSAYLLANCALQPSTGKVYSNYSSKYTFLCFLGIFELGSAICGAAQSSIMLIMGRAVAGLGGSGIMNGALTILGASAPMHQRPAILGVTMACSQLGLVGGPLIGGALTQYASWRWCFFINLPIGALGAFLLLLMRIPDRIDHSKDATRTFKSILSKLDIVGFALFAPFAVMLLLAIEWGGVDHPWNSAVIIGLFCGAGGMLVVFLAWEYHVGDEAMIPFFMLKNRIVWSSCLTALFFYGGVMLVSYYLPIYFQAVKGVSPSRSGIYTLPGILSQMITAVVSGVLVGKLGYYLPWMWGCGVVTAIGTGLMSTFTPHSSTAKWVGYQIIAGLGRGCGMQMPVVAIQNILKPDQVPVGMSVLAFAQTFGGTIFLTIAQTIFSDGLIDGLEKYAPSVNIQTVLSAGATAVRQIVDPKELVGVIEAYNYAINRDFYLAAGTSVATFAVSFGMGWRSVKKKKDKEEGEAVVAEI